MPEASARELLAELGVAVSAVEQVPYSIQSPGARFVIHFTDIRIVARPVAIEYSDLQ